MKDYPYIPVSIAIVFTMTVLAFYVQAVNSADAQRHAIHECVRNYAHADAFPGTHRQAYDTYITKCTQ